MKLQSLFSNAEVSGSGLWIRKLDSFLRFASFAEDNDSIYPYWRIFGEEDKLMFIDKILINIDDISSAYYVNDYGEQFLSDMIDYVIDKKSFLGSYMIENSELSEVNVAVGNDFYWSLRDGKAHYIPNFTVRSIALFADLKLVYETECRARDRFIMNISQCQESKNYFEFVFDTLKSRLRDADGFRVAGIMDIIKTDSMEYIKRSIIKKIDELIAA